MVVVGAGTAVGVRVAVGAEVGGGVIVVTSIVILMMSSSSAVDHLCSTYDGVVQHWILLPD